MRDTTNFTWLGRIYVAKMPVNVTTHDPSSAFLHHEAIIRIGLFA
jgi:hypothetical protein